MTKKINIFRYVAMDPSGVKSAGNVCKKQTMDPTMIDTNRSFSGKKKDFIKNDEDVIIVYTSVTIPNNNVQLSGVDYTLKDQEIKIMYKEKNLVIGETIVEEQDGHTLPYSLLIKKVKFIVTASSGIFTGAKSIMVYFDNEGKNSNNIKFSRVVKVKY